jgi:hypothetical protein
MSKLCRVRDATVSAKGYVTDLMRSYEHVGQRGLAGKNKDSRGVRIHPTTRSIILHVATIYPDTLNLAENSRYSSGSTVISLALASRIYHGIEDVRAFLSNKTTTPKLRLMQFFGLDM